MKTKVYVISDLHLGHANIIRYCNRPFASLGDMDESLIKNWNSTVSKVDTVYYLGDLAYGRGSMHYTEEYDQLLNGNIILLKGNHHDPKKARRAPLIIDYNYDDKQQVHFFLCHDPEKALLSREWSEFHARSLKDDERDSYWTIHGHHHNNHPETFPFINGRVRRVNVSVELTNYKPLELDRLCSLLFDMKVIWMPTLDSEPVLAARPGLL